MHQKHTRLNKPKLGYFHAHEWAIIGAPCFKVQKFAKLIADQLAPVAKVGYVDVANTLDEVDQELVPYHMNYTTKAKFHQFQMNENLDTYQFRWWFNDQDLVLVNGNHFRAKKQIVILDPDEKGALQSKLDSLDQVELILTTDKNTPVYSFLKDHLANSHTNQPVLLSIDQVDEIVQFILTNWNQSIAPINGLVLAGGKSQRMGEDKGGIAYHGLPQREFVANLLNDFCEKTYISCTADQALILQSDYELLEDKLIGLGPFGAIASAFQFDPNKAWLIVACDLPLLNEETIQFLIQHRNRSKLATTFQSPVNKFPEPLITIWEPRSYPVLLNFLSQGYACPRKVLINSDIELLTVNDPQALKNVNNPDEREEVEQILTRKAT